MTVRKMENTPKKVIVVEMDVSTSFCFFMPAYLPTRIVPAIVKPVIRLVMIWVTCVPVETAATLSAGQNQPITIRSTAP